MSDTATIERLASKIDALTAAVAKLARHDGKRLSRAEMSARYMPMIDYSVRTRYGDTFDFLSPAQQEELNRWLRDRFDHADPITSPAAPVARLPSVIEKPRTAKTKATTTKRKTQVRPDAATFAELLESLSESFRSMQIPEMKGNWLPKKDISALHKLGIFIPTPWALEVFDTPRIPAGLKLPNIASVFMLHGKHDTADAVHGRFAFAIREKKLPEGVEHSHGTPYRFGYCVELPEKEKDQASDHRLFWAWAWVVVGSDGSMSFPHQLQPVNHHIRSRRIMPGKKGDGATRSMHYITRQWVDQTMTIPEGRSDHNFLACMFRQLLVWWTSRDQSWSVGVRKDGRRVTFSIAPEHTAAYFADRDLVVNEHGTRKRIIHFVREHTRGNGAIVKAHVRGVRHFHWKGFECNVTAPKLNGAVVSAMFDLPPADDDIKDSAVLDIEDVSSMLADVEDGL